MRVRGLRKAALGLEDVVVGGGKLAIRLARKAVRPVLIGAGGQGVHAHWHGCM